MQETTELARSGTLRMHHGTSERFERVSLDFAVRSGMSGNGHLGVWLAVDAHVEKPYLMPLKELSRLYDRALTRERVDDA